jgi:1,4-dihydroxy-2-naphthoyl-CoA hydrolase
VPAAHGALEVTEVDGVRPALEASAFVRSLGIELATVTPELLEGWFEVGPEHHQPFGIVHGGVYSSVIETVASIAAHVAVQHRGQTAVGVHNATDFLRPHQAGRLEFVAEPLYVGRTQQLWQVVISRAGDGKAVARGQVRLANVAADRLGGGQG